MRRLWRALSRRSASLALVGRTSRSAADLLVSLRHSTPSRKRRRDLVWSFSPVFQLSAHGPAAHQWCRKTPCRAARPLAEPRPQGSARFRQIFGCFSNGGRLARSRYFASWGSPRVALCIIDGILSSWCSATNPLGARQSCWRRYDCAMAAAKVGETALPVSAVPQPFCSHGAKWALAKALESEFQMPANIINGETKNESPIATQPGRKDSKRNLTGVQSETRIQSHNALPLRCWRRLDHYRG